MMSKPADGPEYSPEICSEPAFAGPDGLLPVVAQCASSGRVLMLAWMNREAWLATLRDGWATYYSRSRQSLWRKGDTSGHRQRVLSIAVDCDADTILLQVEQTGAACHEGYRSCFFRSWDGEKFSVTEQRLTDGAPAAGG
jgi:phosphoribosyl-AMP cyclohydrolase